MITTVDRGYIELNKSAPAGTVRPLIAYPLDSANCWQHQIRAHLMWGWGHGQTYVLVQFVPSARANDLYVDFANRMVQFVTLARPGRVKGTDLFAMPVLFQGRVLFNGRHDDLDYQCGGGTLPRAYLHRCLPITSVELQMVGKKKVGIIQPRPGSVLLSSLPAACVPKLTENELVARVWEYLPVIAGLSPLTPAS